MLTRAILCFQDYYFISTSSPDELHNMEGGYCRTHNMKVVFKVGPNSPAAVLTQRCISFLNPCIPTTQFLLISLFQHMSKFSLQFHSRPNIASLFTRALPQKWPSSLVYMSKFCLYVRPSSLLQIFPSFSLSVLHLIH